jgi:hypothetical protein
MKKAVAFWVCLLFATSIPIFARKHFGRATLKVFLEK